MTDSPESDYRPAPASEYLFVISQIGEKGSPERHRADEIFEHVVMPAAAAAGLEAKRSDLDPTPGVITTQIIKGIINAKAVVADLTGGNPNVYFELGVAQSFAKPLVLLIKDAKALPFDVKGEKTISVGDGEVLGATDAKNALRILNLSLEIILVDGFEPSNLVTEVASARSLDNLAPADPIASEIAGLKTLMEETHARVQRIDSRTGVQRSFRHDFAQLKAFADHLVESDRLSRGEINALVSDETSAGFDDWAAKAEERILEVESIQGRTSSNYAFDEEPF